MLNPFALGLSVGRSLRRFVARMMTICRVTPSGPLVAVVDSLMGTPGSPLHGVLAPALVARSADGLETRRGSDGAVLSKAERRVLIVAIAAVAASRYDRAIEVFEQHLDSQTGNVNPRIYESLGAAYLAAGRADEAIQVLQRGLDANKDNPGLTLMLINALASRADWVSVLSLWETLHEDIQIGADLWTRISIVRACRLTGNPLRAEQLARDAVALWPGNDILQGELRICRPYVIDWRRSWTSNGSFDGSPSTHGSIESTGFLKGGSMPIVGWIGPSVVNEAEVRLTVNGAVVAKTVAASVPGVESQKRFSINCAELLQFVGDGDVVEVISESERLTLPGIGHSALLSCGYPSQFDELIEKLDQGFVFTKSGQLRPGLTIEKKRASVDFFGVVSRMIESDSSQPVYPFYGNLLGAVRHNDFIEHDIGGFDALYLCSAREPSSIRSEIVSLCTRLVDANFSLTVKSHSIMIRSENHRECLVDLAYGWFTSDDQLNVSYGWRFRPAKGMDQFVESRHCRLVDRDVRVPGNAEEVLAQLYGPNWRIPDQGFSIEENLKRDKIYLLSEEDIRKIGEYAATAG